MPELEGKKEENNQNIIKTIQKIKYIDGGTEGYTDG